MDEKLSRDGTALRQGPGSYSKKKKSITMSLSSSTEQEPLPRWSMVTSD